MKLLDPFVESRIMKSLNFQEGDRVPIWDYIDNRGILNYFAPGEQDLAKATAKVYHALGIDVCRGFGSSYSIDEEGKKDNLGGSQGLISGQTRWSIDPLIKSIDDLKGYSPHRPTEEDIDKWVSWNRDMQKLFAPYTMFVPCISTGFHATYTPSVMSLETFSIAIYDARDELNRILKENNEINLMYVESALRADLCPICFVGDDIAYKNRLMFSPTFLHETFIPMLKSVCVPLKQKGIKVIFHSDGNVMEVLDDMISSGIDGLNPIEPLAGMNIGYLKKKYYKKLILVGNVDCSQVLPLGTKEEVISATKECIKIASPSGGHFIGSSSEITPSTPVENIITFYETIRNFGRYPINI